MGSNQVVQQSSTGAADRRGMKLDAGRHHSANPPTRYPRKAGGNLLPLVQDPWSTPGYRPVHESLPRPEPKSAEKASRITGLYRPRKTPSAEAL